MIRRQINEMESISDQPDSTIQIRYRFCNFRNDWKCFLLPSTVYLIAQALIFFSSFYIISPSDGMIDCIINSLTRHSYIHHEIVWLIPVIIFIFLFLTKMTSCCHFDIHSDNYNMFVHTLLFIAIFLRLAPRATCYFLYHALPNETTFVANMDFTVLKLTIICNSLSDALSSSALYYLDIDRVLISNTCMYFIFIANLLNHIGIVVMMHESPRIDIIAESLIAKIFNLSIFPLILCYLALCIKWLLHLSSAFTPTSTVKYSFQRILMISLLCGTLLLATSFCAAVRVFLSFLEVNYTHDIHSYSYFTHQVLGMGLYAFIGFLIIIVPSLLSYDSSDGEDVRTVLSESGIPGLEMEIRDDDMSSLSSEEGSACSSNLTVRATCGHVNCAATPRRNIFNSYAEECRYLHLTNIRGTNQILEIRE